VEGTERMDGWGGGLRVDGGRGGREEKGGEEAQVFDLTRINLLSF
jgi:hypothetical protein